MNFKPLLITTFDICAIQVCVVVQLKATRHTETINKQITVNKGCMRLQDTVKEYQPLQRLYFSIIPERVKEKQ